MFSLTCQRRCFPMKSLPGLPSVSLGLQNPKSYVTVSNATCSKSHYDSLGITPHATQTDVKAAYYKLSMMYHPDKNKESDVALQKFREITSAYEVLGNFKLRRLYDKGILHTADDKYQAEPAEATVEDDATTKFYKSRLKRAQPPTMSGTSPIYNFDEWSRAHYGASFARREAARQKFNQKSWGETRDMRDVQKEFVIYSVSFIVMVFFVFSFAYRQDHDIVQPLDGSKENKVPNQLANISLSPVKD